MLSKGWKLAPLGSVLERVVKPVQVDLEQEYREIGIRSHGKGIFHKPPISGESLGDKRVFWIVPDALVLNIVFAWEQAVAITSESENGMIASHRFPMYRPLNGRCDVRFLLHFFKTSRGKELLEIASPGGAGRNKTLGQKEFERLKVPMPSISEQERIAQALAIWDQAIATSEKLKDTNEIWRRGIVHALVAGKKRLVGHRGQWKKVQLKDVADVLVSSVDKKQDADESLVDLCNYTHVYYNRYLTKSIPYDKGTASLSEIERFQLKKRDIVITKDSEQAEDIGVAACVSEEIENLICGYHLAIIRPKEERIDSVFLSSLFSLHETRKHFAIQANGVTRFGLPIKSIGSLRLKLPPIEEQREVAKLIKMLDQEQFLIAKRLECMNRERAALVRQVLTGKRCFRIPEPELGTAK